MLEIERMIEGKSLDELKPSGSADTSIPSERAPYSLKILQEKIHVNAKLAKKREEVKVLEVELIALSRL